MVLQTDMRLINSAIEATARYGVEGATTACICRIAGCSEAMIYKHFNNKNDLMSDAFLKVDKAISEIPVRALEERNPEGLDFLGLVKKVWKNIYEYLLDHPLETMFLIRFRYSSLYTNEVRSKRMAHNGAFDEIEDVIERYLGKSTGFYPGFAVNYVFEITLSAVEKMNAGRIERTQAVDDKLWELVLANINVFTGGKILG